MHDSFERRADERRKTMTVKVARSKSEARAFELQRDRSLTPSQRVDAVWFLTCDLAAIRGLDESELRLDRSLARIERRGR